MIYPSALLTVWVSAHFILCHSMNSAQTKLSVAYIVCSMAYVSLEANCVDPDTLFVDDPDTLFVYTVC